MKLEIFKKDNLYLAKYSHEYPFDQPDWELNTPMKLENIVEYLIEVKRLHAVDVADALIKIEPILGRKYFGIPLNNEIER